MEEDRERKTQEGLRYKDVAPTAQGETVFWTLRDAFNDAETQISVVKMEEMSQRVRETERMYELVEQKKELEAICQELRGKEKETILPFL